MKPKAKTKLKRATLLALVAVAIATSFWIGVGTGSINDQENEAAENEPTASAVPETEKEEAQSYGETGNDVYITEIWDTGEVRIITTQEYINQLSEHTMLVTDRNLDDVYQELLDCMDLQEYERVTE